MDRGTVPVVRVAARARSVPRTVHRTSGRDSPIVRRVVPGTGRSEACVHLVLTAGQGARGVDGRWQPATRQISSWRCVLRARRDSQGPRRFRERRGRVSSGQSAWPVTGTGSPITVDGPATTEGGE